MNYKEALEWLNGKRSMVNMVTCDPLATWQARIAQADAAMCEHAYWIVRANKEKLISEEER